MSKAASITEKLHARADAALKDELEKLVQPLCVRLQYSHNIPHEERQQYRETIWKARDALFAAEQPQRQENEVAEFLRAVEDTRNMIEEVASRQS